MHFPKESIKSNGWLQGDIFVWMVLILLCVISLIEVYSASSNMSYQSGVYYAPVLEHGFYVFLGVSVAWLVHLMPCKLFKFICTLFVVISILLLFYALFFGQKVNGAGRWIVIAGRTIQPSEIAKVSTIGFVAYILAMTRDKKTGKINSMGQKIICIVAGGMCCLILTENFSTAALLGLVIYLMMWIGNVPKKLMLWILIPILTCGLSGYTVAKNMSHDTAVGIAESVPALHRLPTWVGRLQKGEALPEKPENFDIVNNQQVGHAQIAVATSNIIGRGPGKSVERDYLPQAYSDFIYAVIIEEGGIESAILVLGLYLLLFYRAWRIAGRCAARFPAYLAMGLALMLVIQATINMGVAVGLLPVTGQPLPLVSKGGTSTIITCAYIGMILSVSRSAKKIEEPVEKPELQIESK